MTEIYDIVMMVGDLVLILAFLWFISEAALFFMEEFYGASSRIIQEFVSGYASMSSFAPQSFFAREEFPAVNHMMKLSETPPFVFLRTGTKSATSPNMISGGQSNINILLTFAQKPPFSYFLSDSIILTGDCIDNYCVFSGENRNNITILKKTDVVSVLLNRESLSAGSLFKLNRKIFEGECGSKLYVALYKYAGTSSIHVEVAENSQIIKEGPNPTIEVFKGSPKIINNLKITLFDLDTSTNIASIMAECN